jgi:hypothetical protein
VVYTAQITPLLLSVVQLGREMAVVARFPIALHVVPLNRVKACGSASAPVVQSDRHRTGLNPPRCMRHSQRHVYDHGQPIQPRLLVRVKPLSFGSVSDASCSRDGKGKVIGAASSFSFKCLCSTRLTPSSPTHTALKSDLDQCVHHR